jgi:hypothetical protein
MSKERAAKIANPPKASQKGGKSSGSGGNSSRWNDRSEESRGAKAVSLLTPDRHVASRVHEQRMRSCTIHQPRCRGYRMRIIRQPPGCCSSRGQQRRR